MESINSLVSKLRKDFPDFHFKVGETARWSPDTMTVYYVKNQDEESIYELIHELGHGELRHSEYQQDIELISLELEAWERAIETAITYGISIPQETVESHLDSYRDWLHARSRCPRCNQAGIQEKDSGIYECLLCHLRWEANPAKQCGLRRTISDTKTSA